LFVDASAEDSCAHVFSAVRLVLQHDWIMIMILRAFIGSSRIFVLVYVVFIGESCLGYVTPPDVWAVPAAAGEWPNLSEIAACKD
ncbi:hypothetical protein KCU99_g415, partial [Aureobasidium melanogenum]